MRKLRIIEHISLDGVIQAGADDDGGFCYGDWSAPTKYVVTHRPESLEWGPFEGIGGADFLEDVRSVKAKDGPDLILAGSSTLTSALVEHGLADEVLLLVNPVLLGRGKRFFSEATPARAFALVDSKALPSGILVNRYKFEGTLRNLR